MLGNLACFLSSAEFFLKKKYFGNTIRVSNSFDPDQAGQFVGSGMGLNHLQRLSADKKSCHEQTKNFVTNQETTKIKLSQYVSL